MQLVSRYSLRGEMRLASCRGNTGRTGRTLC